MLEPEFIVADESVSALDVSIQAQVLNLLLEIREKRNLTLLFIAHDLSVVEYLCDQIVVIYLGHTVEIGSSRAIHNTPAHPYTRALLSAAPIADPERRVKREILSGDIPNPLSPPSGCVFRTRCAHALPLCGEGTPHAHHIAENHTTFVSEHRSFHDAHQGYRHATIAARCAWARPAEVSAPSNRGILQCMKAW